MALVGAGMLGLGLLLSSQVQALWHLYLTMGLLVGALGYGAMNAPLVANVAQWFARGRGLATGIVYAGVTAGVMLYPLLARSLITALGWRGAYVGLAVVAWAVSIPAALLVRVSPGAALPRTGPAGPPVQPVPVRESLGNGLLQPRPSIWAIRAAQGTCCICMSIPLVHVISYATDLGIAKIAAAGVLSAIGLTGFAGRIGFGLLADGIGGRLTLLVASLAQTAGAAGFLLARGLPGLMGAALLFGVGYGGILPQYPIICREVYGPRGLGRIIGSVSLFGTVGMAAGGYLGGILFDLSGGYTVPLLVSVLFGTVNLTLAAGLALGQHRRVAFGTSPLG
jgi:MFS family permease